MVPYQLFHNLFPELAERETRSITVLAGSDLGLPAGEYGFPEMFCDERGCDCRRVFFYVVSRSHRPPSAIIACGWESYDFYARWTKEDDPVMIGAMRGPILNPGSPQSPLAPALLTFVRDVLLHDADYVARLKRHYEMFRQKIDTRRPVAAGPRRPGGRDRRKR